MIGSPKPTDEEARLRALRRSGGLEGRHEDLAAVAREAAVLAGAPIALVTFVDAERVWVKAAVGLAPDDVDRRSAFCAWAVYNAQTTVVPDAATADRPTGA